MNIILLLPIPTSLNVRRWHSPRSSIIVWHCQPGSGSNLIMGLSMCLSALIQTLKISSGHFIGHTDTFPPKAVLNLKKKQIIYHWCRQCSGALKTHLIFILQIEKRTSLLIKEMLPLIVWRNVTSLTVFYWNCLKDIKYSPRLVRVPQSLESSPKVRAEWNRNERCYKRESIE